MKIKAGCGYYNIDKHPIGGSFSRVGKEGLNVVNVMLMNKKIHGCNAYGKTLDGKQVAFSTEVCEKEF